MQNIILELILFIIRPGSFTKIIIDIKRANRSDILIEKWNRCYLVNKNVDRFEAWGLDIFGGGLFQQSWGIYGRDFRLVSACVGGGEVWGGG